MQTPANAVDFTPTTLKRLLDSKVDSRTDYRDARQPGLRLRATPSGAAAWYVVKKPPGGKAALYIRLGDARAIGPIQARKLARETIARVEQGENPNETRRANALAKTTLGQVFEAYIRDHGRLKASTIADYRAKLNAGFSDWLNKPVADIKESDILRKHKDLTAKGETSCNVRFRVLRAVMGYAVATLKAGDTPILGRNVVDVVAQARLWHLSRRRDRIIPDSQLGAWVAAVSGLENHKARVSLTLMLFLGLRRGEAFTLRWEDLDLESDLPMLALPDPKNRRRHELPLPTTVADALRGLRVETGHTPWVFPKDWDKDGKFEAGPIADVSKPLARVNEKTGLGVSYHDLRRTFATLSTAIGHSDMTVKKLMNHVDSGNVTAGYVRLEIQTKARALAEIEAYILGKYQEFKNVQS